MILIDQKIVINKQLDSAPPQVVPGKLLRLQRTLIMATLPVKTISMSFIPNLIAKEDQVVLSKTSAGPSTVQLAISMAPGRIQKAAIKSGEEVNLPSKTKVARVNQGHILNRTISQNTKTRGTKRRPTSESPHLT